MKGKWVVVVASAVALLIGIAIGAGATAGGDAEPQIVTETETVTETVEVEVGGECREYAYWILEQMDEKDAITLAAFGEMADILDRDGFMMVDEYVDILERATADIDSLTMGMTSGSDFDCPRP